MRKPLILLLAVVALPSIARAQTPPETIEYYATDMIGSIRIVFRPDGAAVARQDYAPFGRPLFPVPAMPKEGFSGNEKDDETDQAYFHARMFQARTGRFARPDPVQSGGGEPQRLNRYAYALNNPTTFGDTNGLNPIPFFFHAGGAGLVGACSLSAWRSGRSAAPATVREAAASQATPFLPRPTCRSFRRRIGASAPNRGAGTSR
jgi:RHS repeat-associated protein